MAIDSPARFHLRSET
ncbi:hypothetical protein LINPERPRIM_LOCUS16942 [Linum perenne]